MLNAISGYTTISGFTDNQKLDYIKEFITNQYDNFLNYTKNHVKQNVDPYEFLNITILNYLNPDNSKKIDYRFKMCLSGEFRFYVINSLYQSFNSPRSLFNVTYKKNQNFNNYLEDYKHIDIEDNESYQEIEDYDQQKQDQINMINRILDDYEKNNWANVKVFKEYYNDNLTIKQLSIKYNLSNTMVFGMLKKTKKYIKANIKAI